MSNHQAKVIRIEEIVKHPNADSLGLVYIDGFQVVVRLDQFKVGDLAIYIQPDSIVPELPQFKFVWERDGSGQARDHLMPGDAVPEKYRRITVRKFRKEWSEGLLMPLSDFPQFWGGASPEPGDDLAEHIGITHWNPPDPEEERAASQRQSRTRPKSLKGWFYYLRHITLRVITLGFYNPYGNTGGANEKAPANTPPIYDVENFKHHADTFQPGETVVVTEKIHGSNARYVYHQPLFGSAKFYAGSRQFWKRAGSSNVWRQVLDQSPDLQAWLLKNPGHTLYGEVTPTQGGFSYGTTKDRPDFWAFDILRPDGTWVPYTEARGMTGGLDIQWAPLLYHGPYDAEKIAKLVDGPTKTGDKHIREGVVIKTEPERHVRGLGRAQLKLVSNAYLMKEQG